MPSKECSAGKGNTEYVETADAGSAYRKTTCCKRVGVVTATGFNAEVGDIGRFDSPKQIQKMAGFEIVENSSSKHNGKKAISKRGRKKLPRILFQIVLPFIRSNAEFRNVYDYYTTRVWNPLKSRQAIIAVACKPIMQC